MGKWDQAWLMGVITIYLSKAETPGKYARNLRLTSPHYVK